MAILPSSATISTVTSDNFSRFIYSSAVASGRSSLSKYSPSSSSLSSLQLKIPLHLRRQLRSSASFSVPCGRGLPQIEATQQTYSSFDELIAKSEKPVLVDFYAVWCGPCQFMNPILEQVAATMKDKILVEKVDTEKYESIADKYSIQALPTFILFKDGEPCDRFEGAMPADELIKRIEAALAVEP